VPFYLRTSFRVLTLCRSGLGSLLTGGALTLRPNSRARERRPGLVYVGMDVHRKRTQVAVLTEDCTQLMNRNVPNDPGELAAIIGPLGPGTPAVFEAAYGWGWLAELCGDLGMELHLAHPFRCKAIASARLNNDKVDARILAHLLRTDLLPEAWDRAI
jgi:transposase